MIKIDNKIINKKIKALPKIKFDERMKKILIVVLSLLIVFGFLFNFKHLFLVALVNNRPITRLALDRELEKQSGQQTLDSLISQSLILQEAKRLGIKIGQTDIDEEIKKIETQVASQGSDLDELLQAQGLSRKSVGEQIKVQLIVEEVLGKDITVSEEEISNYFEENKELIGEDVTFEEIKADIEEQIKQEKLSEKFESWLEELKQKAKIHYFLSF
ncbi:hypothetical protein A2Z41_00705 [Microgenomates group bacterium RBG_19FT_COMBO_39_10]|nr:MAG: hypothetical protein A2Z41_00705 [Microgenomates group bacterium RBG_19FT_COMBO_39_10]